MGIERIIVRKQQKKTLKSHIKQLKEAGMVAFQAGRQSVLEAAHHLDYGPGYEVGSDLGSQVF